MSGHIWLRLLKWLKVPQNNKEIAFLFMIPWKFFSAKIWIILHPRNFIPTKLKNFAVGLNRAKVPSSKVYNQHFLYWIYHYDIAVFVKCVFETPCIFSKHRALNIFQFEQDCSENKMLTLESHVYKMQISILNVLIDIPQNVYIL